MKKFKIANYMVEFSDDFDMINGYRTKFINLANQYADEFEQSVLKTMPKVSSDNVEDYIDKMPGYVDKYITSAVAVAIDLLVKMNIYDYDEKRFIAAYKNKYFSFSSTEVYRDLKRNFLQLEEDYDALQEQKAIDRASRSRWQGGGFGMGGAIKGAMQAGALNMATGAVRSVGDGISDTSGKAAYGMAKKNLLRDKNIYVEIRAAVWRCIFNVYTALTDALIDNGVKSPWTRASSKEKAEVTFNLAKTRVEDEDAIIKMMKQVIEGYPYNSEYYTFLFDRPGIDKMEVCRLAQYVNQDASVRKKMTFECLNQLTYALRDNEIVSKQELINKGFKDIENYLKDNEPTDPESITRYEGVIKEIELLSNEIKDVRGESKQICLKYGLWDDDLYIKNSYYYLDKEVAKYGEKDVPYVKVNPLAPLCRLQYFEGELMYSKYWLLSVCGKIGEAENQEFLAAFEQIKNRYRLFLYDTSDQKNDHVDAIDRFIDSCRNNDYLEMEHDVKKEREERKLARIYTPGESYADYESEQMQEIIIQLEACGFETQEASDKIAELKEKLESLKRHEQSTDYQRGRAVLSAFANLNQNNIFKYGDSGFLEKAYLTRTNNDVCKKEEAFPLIIYDQNSSGKKIKGFAITEKFLYNFNVLLGLSVASIDLRTIKDISSNKKTVNLSLDTGQKNSLRLSAELDSGEFAIMLGAALGIESSQVVSQELIVKGNETSSEELPSQEQATAPVPTQRMNPQTTQKKMQNPVQGSKKNNNKPAKSEKTEKGKLELVAIILSAITIILLFTPLLIISLLTFIPSMVLCVLALKNGPKHKVVVIVFLAIEVILLVLFLVVLIVSTL